MALIVLFSIFISLFDLRHHRITNHSVVIISILLVVEGDFQVYFLSGILFLAPLLVLGKSLEREKLAAHLRSALRG